MIQDPTTFWRGIAERPNWKDYILPGRTDADFDAEGFAEAQRLFCFFDNSSTVVDYGCGIGRVLKYVAPECLHAVGIDICPAFLTTAAELIKRDNVALFQPDEYRRENVADLVYSLMVLQHNDPLNQLKIMCHIHRILRPNGTAIVNFPRHESAYYKEGPFVHKFTRREVATFGGMFRFFRIFEGNLSGYEKQCAGDNEYFLIAVK